MPDDAPLTSDAAEEVLPTRPLLSDDVVVVASLASLEVPLFRPSASLTLAQEA